MQGALRRYRIMSVITGTALLLLVFVAIPLTWAHHGEFGKVLGVAHGVFLYPIYLVTVVQLWYVARLRWWWAILMLLAGFVPFLAFVMEHFVTKEVRARAAAVAAPLSGRPA